MALTKTQVSELYVAIFNRASEKEGNEYWQTQGDAASVANAMLATSDAQEYFGSSIDDDQAFIELIYKNTLNKTVEDDAEGIAYWVSELASGKSRGDVVVDLINAISDYANATDAKTKAAYDQFENRVNVSNHAADVVDEAPENYKVVLGFEGALNVDNTLDSVGVAEALLDGMSGGGAEVKLSTGSDRAGMDDSDNVDGNYDKDLQLTVLDDKIDGTEKGSLQAADVIEDPSTADNDTLEAVLSGDLGVNDANGDNLAPNSILDNMDVTSGPTITNIEHVILRDDDLTSVINTDGMSGVKNLDIDTADSTIFNSLNDIDLNEIANLDGDKVAMLNAIDRTQNLAISDVRNAADITLKDDFKNLYLDAYAEDGEDDTVTVNMKGADFNLALFDDNDDADAEHNDGGAFKEMTLVSADNASTVTLVEGTSLNNVTDDTANTAGAATAAEEDADGAGTDTGGTEGSMQTISANDGTDNSVLAHSLLLDGDQDITLVGTGIQFDEARIKELSDEKLTSTIDLTLSGEAEIGAPVDLTRAEVDLVTIKALGDDAVTAEYMEVDLDQDTRVRVDAIQDLDTLLLTGDHQYDTLDIDLNVGNADAALGRLVLGGDASATTTDSKTSAGTAGSVVDGSEANGAEGAATTTAPDTETADAMSANINVIKDSNLGVLDISQITGKTVTFTGSEDIRIYELIMGNGGPGHAGDQQANKIDATAMTGDFTANLTALGIKTSDNNGTPDNAWDDGNGIDDNAKGGDTPDNNGKGVTIELGSGNDELNNVGVVDATEGWNFGDNISMGDGDDVVEIGSMSASIDNSTHGELQDDAVSAEIWGGDGKDTFIFRSVSDTDKGAAEAGTLFNFADKGTNTYSSAPVNDAHDNYSDLSGISLVQIEDFDAAGEDQLDFQLFRDIDGEGLNMNDTAATAELFHNGEILDANGTNRYVLDDGEVALVKVADLSIIDAESVVSMFGDTVSKAPSQNSDDTANEPIADGTVAKLFEDSDINEGAPQSDFNENIIIVGEEDGNAGIKIFYVREGGNALPSVDAADPVVDHIEATLIGQLNAADSTTLNITSLTVDNFDFA